MTARNAIVLVSGVLQELPAGDTLNGASGSSGNKGTTVIDFGAFPGSNEASVAVTGQTTISTTSKCEAFIMGDDGTSDHTAEDHKYFSALVGLSCGTPTTGSHFEIHARSTEKLQGTFALRWVWSD